MSRDWVQINFPSFQSIRQSGCTHELGRPFELSWANKAEQVERVFIYALAPGETIPSVATTAEHVGRLLSERYDPKDAKPWNYTGTQLYKLHRGTCTNPALTGTSISATT